MSRNITGIFFVFLLDRFEGRTHNHERHTKLIFNNSIIMTEKINIPAALEEIGNALIFALEYRPFDPDKIDRLIKIIDTIIDDPGYIVECQEHFRSAGSNYILFFLSNIIYNLKQQGELVLTPEVLKWLSSVWKNFLKRNKSYQENLMLFSEERKKLNKYYPGEGNFVNQIDNVNQVREDFVDNYNEEESPLTHLEKVYQVSSEVLTWMKPTYFFLMDYYYERKLNTGEEDENAVRLETGGLAKFGHQSCTYFDIALLAARALGVLEAAYLLLKKKKSSRRIITIDGKQKFLTTAEIYVLYLDKFNSMKKEITALKKT